MLSSYRNDLVQSYEVMELEREGGITMITKAIFLDFYGTVVHEDDEIIPLICQKIKETSSKDCTIQEIGQYW